MKLDVNVLRYLQKDEFRTLTAVEMGQKNVSRTGVHACGAATLAVSRSGTGGGGSPSIYCPGICAATC